MEKTSKSIEKILKEREELYKEIMKAKENSKRLKLLKMIYDNLDIFVPGQSILHQKNLHKLLKFLRDIYPLGYTFEGLKKKLKIEELKEEQLMELYRQDILYPTYYEKKPEQKVARKTDYRITMNGIQLLNNFEQKNSNKILLFLTIMITILTIILAVEPVIKLVNFVINLF